MRHGSPSNTITIPRRIWVAGIAIGAQPSVFECKLRQPLNLEGAVRQVKRAELARSRRIEHRFERTPQVVSHDAFAGVIRVYAVRLVQLVFPRDVSQQKWQESDAGLFRDVG